MNKLLWLFVLALLFTKLYAQAEINKLSLNEAFEIGLKQNPELKSSSEKINAANGKFWQGISLPQPELELSYEYVPVNGSLSNYSERTFAISQSFEFPTNYFLRGNKFSKEEEIAFQECRLKEKKIIAEIKSAYYKVLTKQNILKFAIENLAISEDFFEKSIVRLNVGEGTNLEQLTAKVQLSEAKNKLEIAKNDLKAAFAELNYALGYGNENYNSNPVLTDSLTFAEHTINFEKIIQIVEESNSQILIAELNTGIFSVEKTLAWSSLLPQFNLSYFRQSVDGNNNFYGAAFGVSVPLWFLFEQRGTIQEATANHSISESNLVQTENEIILKLKNAYTDYTNNQQQLKTYIHDIIPQAEEVYRTAKRSFDEGELSYLEYMQAKQLMINARENYISALFNYNQTLIILEEIIGKNLSELEN